MLLKQSLHLPGTSLFFKTVCLFSSILGIMVWTVQDGRPLAFDEIARDYAGRIKIYKLDADDYPQIADFEGIDRVPTVLLFKNGEKLKSLTGTMPKSLYVEAIEQLLSH
ncbi:unnamed protein product [Musa acuminata var. zebrina]